MLLGCMMMPTANFFWTLYEPDASCGLHTWLFQCGYILFFAPLFARTARLYLIFSSTEIKLLRLSDAMVFLCFVAPPLGVELTLLVIWTAAAPFQATLTAVDPLRPLYNYQLCSYSYAARVVF